MVESDLFNQNSWWTNSYVDSNIRREKYLSKLKSNLDSREILFLTGLRRIGKTTILKQLISDLLADGVLAEDIFYVSLDSYSLINYSIHDIIEVYRGIHKKRRSDFIYIFLDEVTAKKDFALELKSLYDSENVKIICSSSIASMMRDQKAYLTGRTKTFEVMPLDFKEYLLFKGIKIERYEQTLLETYFKDYLKVGGVPQYVLTGDGAYLNELVQSIIYKDIIAYYGVSNAAVINELFKLLCERVGKSISYSKISRILNISVDSVKRYISYFESTYLFYTIDKFAKSLNQRTSAPKKIYIGDVGIKNIVTGFRDLGASYENLVYLKIKDASPNYYLDNSIEIDFITSNYLIEAKFGLTLTDRQQKLFDSIKIENKVVANGVKFFLD